MTIKKPCCFLTSWNPAIASLGKATNRQLLPSEASRLQVHLRSLQPRSATPASLHEDQAVWGLYHKGVHKYKARHSGRHETHQLRSMRQQTICFPSVSKQHPLYSTASPGPSFKEVSVQCTLQDRVLHIVTQEHLEWSKEDLIHCH